MMLLTTLAYGTDDIKSLSTFDLGQFIFDYSIFNAKGFETGVTFVIRNQSQIFLMSILDDFHTKNLIRGFILNFPFNISFTFFTSNISFSTLSMSLTYSKIYNTEPPHMSSKYTKVSYSLLVQQISLLYLSNCSYHC